jgi:hypothetical protein
MKSLALNALWQAFKLGVSIAVTVASAYAGIADTPHQKVIIAILTFVAFNVLEALAALKSLAGRRDREELLWRVEEALDANLINIRRSFRELSRHSYGRKDLFVEYFATTIQDLSQQVKEASETKALKLRNYHFRSIENVLAAFEGSKVKTFMELWILEKGEPLIDSPLGAEYFAQIAVMAKKGYIRSVRTVFVFSDASCIEEPSVRTLLAFYASWPRFDCRLVQSSSCHSLMDDEGIRGGCIDFGVYGDRYLFKTVQYRPDVVGVFTKDEREIQRYARFFENLWNSAGARRNPEPPRSGMTLETIVSEELVRSLGA